MGSIGNYRTSVFLIKLLQYNYIPTYYFEQNELLTCKSLLLAYILKITTSKARTDGDLYFICVRSRQGLRDICSSVTSQKWLPCAKVTIKSLRIVQKRIRSVREVNEL